MEPSNDAFLADALKNKNVRPPRGALYCEMYSPGVTYEEVEGIGTIKVKAKTESGIVLTDASTTETEAVTAYLYVVRALGNPPDDWHTLFIDRERSWPVNTWTEQAIDVGTVIAIRPVAGIGQSKTSRFKQVRYDEIVAIGRPLDEVDYPPMLPAPGWVMLEMDDNEGAELGGLLVSAGVAPRLESGSVDWGTVVAVPRGLSYEDEDVAIGDRVGIPYHRGAGATEWLDFAGGLRAVPFDNVWVKEP